MRNRTPSKNIHRARYAAPLFALLLLPQLSIASEISGYCPPGKALRPLVRNCSTNFIAVEAGDRCIAGFMAKVQLAQGKLNASLEKEALLTRSGQYGDLQNLRNDTEAMRSTLSSLQKEAEQVRKHQMQYLESLSFPGGISRETAKALGLEGVLSGIKCFSSSADAVKAGLANMGKKISELKSSGLAAAIIQDRGIESQRKLNNFPEKRIAKTEYSAPQSSQNGASEISGELNNGALIAVSENSSAVENLTQIEASPLAPERSISSDKIDVGLNSANGIANDNGKSKTNGVSSVSSLQRLSPMEDAVASLISQAEKLQQIFPEAEPTSAQRALAAAAGSVAQIPMAAEPRATRSLEIEQIEVEENLFKRVHLAYQRISR